MMLNELRRLFREPFSKSMYDVPSYPDSGEMVLTPRMDIYDAKDSWKVKLDLPGVPKQNVVAEVRGRCLHVQGQTGALKDSEKSKNLVGERRHGKYSRDILLPTGSDQSKVKAEYKNGTLVV